MNRTDRTEPDSLRTNSDVKSLRSTSEVFRIRVIFHSLGPVYVYFSANRNK